jgi:hypothetical protein
MIRLEDDGPAADDEAQSEFDTFQHSVSDMSKRKASLNRRLGEARAASDEARETQLKKDIRRVNKQLEIAKSGQTTPQGAPDDLFTIRDLIVVPTDLNVELNGFRTADKLTATFPFADLPLTSRIIRSCLVEAYLGTVPAEAFANPALWRLPFDKTTIMFRGYVDEWKTEHKEDTSEVRIEARSMESILIDQKVNKLAKVFQVGRIEDFDDPKKVRVLKSELITHYLTRFFSTLPNLNGALGGDTLRAKWDGRGKEPAVDRKLFTRALQSAQSQNQAAGGLPGQMVPPPPQPTDPLPPGTTEGTGVANVPQPHAQCDTSAWDIVTIACELVGCIPVYDPSIDPDNIIVRLPQTVYDDEGQFKNPEDGFSRALTDPDTLKHVTTPFRMVVWGRNVKELSTSRKLGRVKAPAVEVVAYNCDAFPDKRQIRVRFPDTKRATRVGATGKGKTDEVITQVVNSVRDEEQLKQIAVALYHARARHETSVHFVTDSMSSYSDPSGPVQDPDLLRLRPGNAVRVLVARYNPNPADGLNLTPLTDAFGQDEAQITAFLADQFRRHSKMDPGSEGAFFHQWEKVAARIAGVATEQKSRNLYYVRTCNHKFNKDAGWNLEGEVATFARATSDPARMSQKDKATNDRRKLPQKRGKPVKTPEQVAYDRASSVAGRREVD